MTEKKKTGTNPIFAAVTGVVVGAGVAIAGVVALKDKGNLKVVKGVLNNLLDSGEKFTQSLKKNTKDKN